MSHDMSLRIKGFKRIRDEIVLADFAKFNLFVGKNNSGKSSILNAITLINDGLNAKMFFNKESIAELRLDGIVQRLSWDENNPNATANMTINPSICSIGDDLNGMGQNNNTVTRLNTLSLQVERKPNFEDLNSFLKSLGIEELTAGKHFDDKDVWSIDHGMLFFKQGDVEIEPNYLASGIKKLYWLTSRVQDFIRNNRDKRTPIFIVIEEPENNLNPSLQKRIPALLDETDKNAAEGSQAEVFYFISTHSPFIVSAAANLDSHKLYLLDEGMPIAINQSNLSWSKTKYSKGYSGNACSYIVGYMLGSDMADIGYPTNYCIIEEYSLQVLLDGLRSKGIVKDYALISAAGSSNVEKYFRTMQHLKELNTILKCNPFYYDKYLVVIDNYGGHSQKERSVLDRIKASLGPRFVELKKQSIEDYYPNLSPELSSEYSTQKAGKTPAELGSLKTDYAERMVELINDPKDFRLLFENELDLLLQ